ncbi:MAG: AAA domain-containing protein [Olpidium bornovanus]|uniref:DNA replication ATP-dependent helicase/nuclease n=1 Tax=Olpidium bornovanus TaxID=278681 RepID=A0A8H7ZZL3_9FUNG|nr:MAG: AAA domain-containing protein [Olpidium bornovanus]
MPCTFYCAQLPGKPFFKVKNPQAAGLSISLFKTLSDAHPKAVLNLEHQYRMSADIMTVSNTLVYRQRLKCASPQVAGQALVLPHTPRGLDLLHDGDGIRSPCDDGPGCWLRYLLDPRGMQHNILSDLGNIALHGRRRVVFVDTDNVPAPESRPVDSIINEVEAAVVHHTAEALVACGLEEGSLGIISPYRAQLKVISYLLRRRTAIEIHTVDKFQGRDKDCVLVSLVRSNCAGQADRTRNPDRGTPHKVGGLLSDWRRLNVAFTRAKRKLIIFGSGLTLRATEHLCRFLDLVKAKGWVRIFGGRPPSSHALCEAPTAPQADNGRAPPRIGAAAGFQAYQLPADAHLLHTMPSAGASLPERTAASRAAGAPVETRNPSAQGRSKPVE